MRSLAVPAIITSALLFWAAAAVSPYVVLSYMAHRQFGEDFLYILPQHDVPSDQAIPDHVCTSDIIKLDYSAFVYGAANLVLKIDRPTFLAMHAGVLKSKKVYTWSFRHFRFDERGSSSRSIFDSQDVCDAYT
jgi:hypothetical protein